MAAFFTRRGAFRAWAILCLAGIAMLPCETSARPFGGSAKSEKISIVSGGQERSYLLYVPSSYDPSQAAPLVVALHPGFSTDAAMEKLTRFDEYAEKNGFIVAYPNGIKLAWNAGTCCATPMREHVNDVQFVADVLHDIVSNYRIDISRRLVTGFSNGAFLTHYIACLQPDLFTHYATVEGTLMTSPSQCQTGRPTSFLIIHGTADPRVPYSGGTFEGTYRMSVADQVSMLASRNQCRSTQQSVFHDKFPAMCKTVEGCAGEVSYCALSGVGHQWAGERAAMTWLLGPGTTEFSDSQAIIDFFLRGK